MSELTFAYTIAASVEVDNYAGLSGIIVHPKPVESGKSSKISFTSKLIEESKLELSGIEHVSFGYGPNGKILAFNTGKQPTSSRIAKNGTISNKKLHGVFVKDYSLDDSIINLILVSDIKVSSDINYVELGELHREESPVELTGSLIEIKEEVKKVETIDEADEAPFN